MSSKWTKWAIRLVAAAVLIAAMLVAWRYLTRDSLGEGIASGNGRIEATEVDVAAKAPGRVRAILAREGDEVKAGQVLATIDVDTLEAQRVQAQAPGHRETAQLAARQVQGQGRNPRAQRDLVEAAASGPALMPPAAGQKGWRRPLRPRRQEPERRVRHCRAR